MNCEKCGGRLNAMRVRNARIVEMAQQGKTRREIMDTLKLSPRIVYTVIRKAGVKPGKARHRTTQTSLLDKNKDVVAAMVAERKTHMQIAAHFGVGKCTVDRFIVENGMRQRARRSQPEPVRDEAYEYAARTRSLFHHPMNERMAAA